MADGGVELLDDPVARELLQSRIPARLSYVWRDGTPRVVPIWFHWTGAEMVFGTFTNSPKVKAIADGDRVAVCIDTNEYPHRVLLVRGPAQITMHEEIVEEYVAAAKRYFGDDGGDQWIAGMPKGLPMARISVRPEHVRILDFETRFPSALSS